MMKEYNKLHWGKKLLLTILVSASFSYAELINGIALTVNDDAITVNDINERMQNKQVKKADAVSSLIDEILYQQEVHKHNISTDLFEFNKYLEQIAASNGMDLYTFKSIVKQKYKDYSKFEKDSKAQLVKRKLASSIVRGNIKVATDEDLKLYYDNNQKMFTTSSKINATQYTSKNKRALQAIQKNPMAIFDDVEQSNVLLNQNNLNAQLKFLINDTKVNTFTPIFTANQQYVMLYIQNKEGIETLKFEEVKNRIFAVIMEDREQKYLNEYFEKLKLTANIKVIR